MSNNSNKIYIKVESSAEQQENLRNTRKSLKVLQKTGIDKENVVEGPFIAGKIGTPVTKEALKKKFLSTDALFIEEVVKKKKVETRSTQTDTATLLSLKTPGQRTTGVTINDLTSTDEASEAYWEILAEKRRQALEGSLVENKKLHERVEGLEEEIRITKEMFEEAKNTIEVLKEILTEQEEELNNGASTSGGLQAEQEDASQHMHSSDEED